MLELRSVTKRIGTFEIRDVNLRIQQGEYFILLGPSGVGKTVLIEMIAGLIRPESGSILWCGRDITNKPPEKRRFAVVYQDCALFPHMTVAENVAYGLRPPDRQRLVATADKLGITHLLNRYPRNLSGGEQQRVAIARAVVAQPELLLLDEPLASLDPNTRARLRKELKRIHSDSASRDGNRGLTFLHVTHDLEEALWLGDRVGVMLNGRILHCGTPEALFRQPSEPQIAEFLGMRNVLAVSHAAEGICEVGGLRIHAAEATEPVRHVWIRPEEIVLSKEPFESSARNQFRGRVIDWERSATLVAVRVSCGGLTLTAFITYASFNELGIRPGADVYVTFKSSSVHTF